MPGLLDPAEGIVPVAGAGGDKQEHRNSRKYQEI
jgi:hypothetical protein